MSASGSTNYEDGLQDALGCVNGGHGIAGADVNKDLFVSDGNPTVWNSGGNGDDSDAANVQPSMNQVLGSDGTNEPPLILATGYSRSEEPTSDIQSIMTTYYAVCSMK